MCPLEARCYAGPNIGTRPNIVDTDTIRVAGKDDIIHLPVYDATGRVTTDLFIRALIVQILDPETGKEVPNIFIQTSGNPTADWTTVRTEPGDTSGRKNYDQVITGPKGKTTIHIGATL